MAATTLAKIIGVEQGVRPVTEQYWRMVRDAIAKEQLLVGYRQTYEAEEGHLPQPPKEGRIQVNVENELAEAREKLSRWFDVTATKDWGNAGEGGARADVVIDGTVLLSNVPAPFLLFLNARLEELHTALRKMPTQGLSEDWERSTEPGIWRTPQDRRASTAKVTSWEQIVAPTDHHPADVREVSKDVISGWWTTVKFTSAPTREWQTQILARISQLREAVQAAIYDANRVEVRDVHVGSRVFGWIFDGTVPGK